MKTILLLPALLLTSCAPPPAGSPPSAPPQGGQSDQQRKIIGLQEKFDRFDYDGNAELTRREIVEGLRIEGTPGVTTAEIDQLFATYDTNRNGSISIPEVNAAEASHR